MATIDLILGRDGGQKKSVVSPVPAIDPSLGGGAQPTAKPVTRGTHTEAVRPTAKQPEQPTQQPTQPEKRDLSYVELFEMLNPNKPETAEERAKREKKEKRERVFSALSDGISALSNLFFTTRYAPNTYDPSQGMSATTKARWDKLRAEREANLRAYNDGYLRAVAMDKAADKEAQNWRHQLEREKKADEYRAAQESRAEAKADMEMQMAEARLALQLGKLDYQTYLNEIARIKAENQGKLSQSEINRNNRSGTRSGGTGSGGKRYYGSLPDRNGKMVEYYSRADYEAALNEEWRGINPDREQTSTQTKTTKDGLREKTTTTSTTKKKAKSTGEKAGEAKSKGKWANTSKIKW